jgi:hypothetical protein
MARNEFLASLVENFSTWPERVSAIEAGYHRPPRGAHGQQIFLHYAIDNRAVLPDVFGFNSRVDRGMVEQQPNDVRFTEAGAELVVA